MVGLAPIAVKSPIGKRPQAIAKALALSAPLVSVSSMLRRTIALALIAAMQAIACLPTLPASECTKSVAERAAEHARMHEGHDHAAHWFSPNGPRIECGCGCHASIDGLPQLLAPHAPASFPGWQLCADDEQPTTPVVREAQTFFQKDDPPPKSLI